MNAHRLTFYFTSLGAVAVGADTSAASARSALRLVRGCLVPPVNALIHFSAVPNLGFVEVQAPAARRAGRGAAAAHAGPGGVEVASQGFGFGCSSSFAFTQVTLLSFSSSQGESSPQVFHAEGHVPVKNANEHVLSEAHEVDLSDISDLRDDALQLTGFCVPLHRHGQVQLNPVRAAAITVPDVEVRTSNRPIETQLPTAWSPFS